MPWPVLGGVGSTLLVLVVLAALPVGYPERLLPCTYRPRTSVVFARYCEMQPKNCDVVDTVRAGGVSATPAVYVKVELRASAPVDMPVVESDALEYREIPDVAEPMEPRLASRVVGTRSRAYPRTESRESVVQEEPSSASVVEYRAPAFMDNEPPPYPTLAIRRGYEGEVVLEVLVAVDGTCGNVNLTQSSGFRCLDSAAIAAVRTWRFRPALCDGVPVAALLDVPVKFELRTGL